MIVGDFAGEVPQTMEELTRLPGVGRKTANIVLNKAFGVVDGIAVDTHVFRIARRLRLTNATAPAAAEKDLLAVIPRELWSEVNEEWIHFGRETCSAQRPACEGCPLADICPSVGQPNRWFKGKK
jgi:endonuclease-3